MRLSTEAPPQDPSTDGDRPLRHPVFGTSEPDQHEDQHHMADSDAAAWHDEQPDGAVTDDGPNGDRRMDGQVYVHRDDEAGTTRDDVEAAAFDEPAPHDPAVETPADELAAVTGAHAADSTEFDEPTDFRPGDAPAAAVTAIWTDDSAGDLRNRWREAQLGFVDDPQHAADDIRTLVNEAVETLTAALASHREQLDSWPANGDTEQYRMIVQRYRTFFERLLTL